MKKVLLGLSFLILSLIFIISIPVQCELKISEEGSFFWKVKSETATVFLFGSIHMAKKEIYPLPKNVETAYDISDALVVEVDLNDIDPFKMMNAAMYQDTRTLKSELPDSTYFQLTALLDKNNIPKIAYQKMKPWMAVITVMMMELQNNGFDESLGIDKHFLEKAKNNKEVLQLESAEEQLNLLNNELENYQLEFVRYSLMDNENMIAQVDSLLLFWKTGNYTAMEHLALDPSLENPEFKPIMNKIYSERNIKMTNKIIEYLNTNKTYFVVVGSAHLIGKDGIIDLLKRN